MDDEIKVLITEVYNEILSTTLKVLRNCQLFDIDILRDEDPTYEVIAEKLELTAGFISAAYSAMSHKDAESMHTSFKALEYAVNVKNIARAITENDQDLLEEFIEALDRRPFL